MPSPGFIKEVSISEIKIAIKVVTKNINNVFAPTLPNFFVSLKDDIPQTRDVKISGTTVIFINSMNPFPTNLNNPFTIMSSM